MLEWLIIKEAHLCVCVCVWRVISVGMKNFCSYNDSTQCSVYVTQLVTHFLLHRSLEIVML